MNRTLLIVCSILLCGCTRNAQLAPYASCRIDETYVAQKDLLALEYDYLQIPLVKPGFQLFDFPRDELANARPEMKIRLVGTVHKGDAVVIDSFVEEGGWIPCKGNWYMANPMVRVLTGELAGKVVGISLLCDFQRDGEHAAPYKTGHIGFMQLEETCLVRK